MKIIRLLTSAAIVLTFIFHTLSHQKAGHVQHCP